jgi:uncharacterized membrane protein YphA (DoxX/SURF4 family)
MARTSDIAGPLVAPSTLRVVFGWVICVLLALVFLMAGGVKLLSKPALVQEFDQIGLGQWFRYFTGALEVTGAVCLLIPKLSRWAALLLAVVMIGAIIAHLTVLHSSPGLPIALLVLATLAAWLRR